MSLKLTANGIPLSLRPAFQEYDIESLHPLEDSFTVIERTMSFGNRDEIQWLFNIFGKKTLSKWFSEYGRKMLPNRRYLLWENYFRFPVQEKKSNKIWPH